MNISNNNNNNNNNSTNNINRNIERCQKKINTLVLLGLTLNDTINYWYRQNFRHHPVRTLLQKGPFYWPKIFYRSLAYLSKKYILFVDENELESTKEEHIVSAEQDIRYTLLVLQKWSKLNAELTGLLSHITTCDNTTDERVVNQMLQDIVKFFEKNRKHYHESSVIGQNGGLMMLDLDKLIDEHLNQIRNHVLPVYKQPNHFYRNWVKYTLFLIVGGYGAYTAFKRRDQILNWSIETYESVGRFYKMHLEEPIVNMYNVIRYDKHTQLMDPQSLDVDVDSLERMVKVYAADHGVDGRLVTPEELEIISEQARRGNLEYIMHQYETQMQAPVKNALFGDMARLLLIQVQKQKVDVERTMVAMDKLMQANELNFEIMATLPVVILAAFLSYNVVTYRQRVDLRMFINFKSNLQHVERMLNRMPPAIEQSTGNNEGEETTSLDVSSSDIQEASDTYNYNQVCGFIYIHLWAMRRIADQNVSSFQAHYRSDNSIGRDLNYDMDELLNNKLTATQRLKTVDRMYCNYPFITTTFLSQ
jgi:hypothetical protein